MVQKVGNFLITSSQDKTVKFWDVHNGDEQHCLLHSSSCYNFDVYKSVLAVATDSAVVLWNMESFAKIHEFKLGQNIFDLKFNPSGNKIIAGLHNGEVFKIELN